ncbi:chemotaxis protein MotB [bacterium]|nr:MAG: chemotaxis protein MotB [bacterium]
MALAPQPLKADESSRSRGRRRVRGGEEQHHEAAGMMRWLLTYADMITLLLALFIILFAISTISSVKFNRFAKEVNAGFNGREWVNQPPRAGQKSDAKGGTTPSQQQIEQQLATFLKEKHLQSEVRLRVERRGLVVSLLTDKALYRSGSADIGAKVREILDEVTVYLRKTKNDISVEGNTDDVPIHTAAYPTNWELSTARATNVVRYLVERDRIAATRISAAGYGEFRPLVVNDSPEHRQINRRVDIVLLSDKATAQERRLGE